MHKRIICLTFIVAALLASSGCGIIDYFYLPAPENTAQDLFENGNDAMHEKNYVKAVEYYSKLKETYPFSPYTKEAEVSLGDAYYLDEEYVLAAEAYKDFESMHPRDEMIAYVLLQIARSDIKSYRSIDRPTTQLIEAEAYLRRIMDSYPNSGEAKEATDLLAECRRTMAEHEIYLADLFMTMGKYGAAWKRYENTADKFQDVPDLATHAKEKAKVAYVEHLKSDAQTSKDEQNTGIFKSIKGWL